MKQKDHNFFYKKYVSLCIALFLVNLFYLYGAEVPGKESKKLTESVSLSFSGQKEPVQLQIEGLHEQLSILRVSLQSVKKQSELMAKSLALLQQSLVDLKDNLVFGKKTPPERKVEEKEEKKDYLSILLEDMKKYKTSNSNFHAGHLYAHSVWVEQTICDWCRSSPPHGWCQGVEEKDKRIVALAGLLHDVGKAGSYETEKEVKVDGKITERWYFAKATHPEVGFQYLIGEKQYFLVSGEQFDFDKLFTSLDVDSEQRKIIAVLVGIHWDFGVPVECSSKTEVEQFDQTVIKFIKEKQNTTLSGACSQYLKKLQGYVERAGYNNGKIDERVLRMAILIGAADVKGSQKSDATKSSYFFTNVNVERDHPEAPYKFVEFGFDIPEIMATARDYLLDYFKVVWQNQ